MHPHYKGIKQSRKGIKAINKIAYPTLREFQNLAHRATSEAIPVGKKIRLSAENNGWDIQITALRPDTDEVLPVVVYYHGGGFIFGQANQIIARLLIQHFSCVAVFVDYRLSPEYPFPIPLEDCYVATKYVYDNIDLVGGDKQRFFTMGDSAGGSLALGIMQLAHQREGFNINKQVLIYPLADFYPDFKLSPYKSVRECGKNYLLTNEFIKKAVDSYCSPKEYGDPLIFALKRDNLSFSPPSMIILSELDPLRSEGEALHSKLTSEGVNSHIIIAEGMLHAFMELGHLTEVQDIYKSIAKFLGE